MVYMDLQEIAGKGNVLDDAHTLALFSMDEGFAAPVKPQCVVRVYTMEEVQGVVQWANQTKTPLVPVSSGPPRFRSDTVPGTDGAVVIDLSQMKRIHCIDRKNRVAIVEPGVTFGEMIPALKKEGLSPYMPLVPRSSKSVLMSSLERDPITMPRDHWETQDPLLCVEVIYGSGDLFRTGSAVGPGNIEEQRKAGKAQVRGLGPSQIDFTRLIQAAQGTMGIVTWGSIKCNLLPKVNQAFLVGSEKLGPLIDFIYKLMWKKLGNECVLLNAQNLACLLGADTDGINSLYSQLPPWILIFNIAGHGLLPQERVDYQTAEFKDIARSYGLAPVDQLSGISSEDVIKRMSRPSPDPYFKKRLKGGSHDIFFNTTLDRTPEFLAKTIELAADHSVPPSDLGIYIQPTVQGTNCHFEINLYFDPDDNGEAGRIQALDTATVNTFADMGGFFSRPYGNWVKTAYERCPDTVEGLKKLKQIFDPNGIMNPGKLCF